MNSRFERLIVGAVAVGALTLAGCSSSGGGGGGGGGGGDGGGGATGDPSELTLLGARTLSDTQIELTFSDAVQVTDSDKAASLFSLHGNKHHYGIFEQGGIMTTLAETPDPSVVIATGTKVTHPEIGPTITSTFLAYESFRSGDEFAVSKASADGDTVTLTLSSVIPNDADDDTGLLRLTYTGDKDGVQDADGNYVTDVELGKTDSGDVADTVGPADEGPKLVGAKTINSKTVELTFNKTLEIGSVNDVLDGFLIVNNGFRGPGSVGFKHYSWRDSYSNVTSSEALGFYGCRSGLVVRDSAQQIYYSCNSVEAFTATIGGGVTWDDATIPDGSPNMLRLMLTRAIPSFADHDTGRLRLFYNADSSRITDEDGNPAPSIIPAKDNPGNVKDTIQ